MLTVLSLKTVEFRERRKTVHEFIPLKAIKKTGFRALRKNNQYKYKNKNCGDSHFAGRRRGSGACTT